jgi:hypothetical protein
VANSFLFRVLFRVLSWLILLADKDAEKKEKPEQHHQKQRDNRDEQAAEIGPRFLIPRVRFGTMRTLSFACQKRTLASGANFDFHRLRISKIAGKFNGFRTPKADFVFLKRDSRFFEKHSKNRLCKANIVCAARFLRVQTDFSLCKAKFCLCRAFFLCAERFFFVQSLDYAVQRNLHTVQTDLHTVQSNRHTVQSNPHTVQGDLHAVQSVRRVCGAIYIFC